MAIVEITPDNRRTSAPAPTTDDFDALFRSGYARLVATVTFVCGDREVAAECVADAFERAYVRWRKVSQLEDPLGWVRRVAINRATDVHRRATRGRRALERLQGREQRRTSTPPGLTDAAAFRDSGVAAVVAELSPQQRAVVALHYLDDVPVAEVATLLGLNAGTVKYHLHQARERLRVLLAETPAVADERDDR